MPKMAHPVNAVSNHAVKKAGRFVGGRLFMRHSLSAPASGLAADD
jgi:hypothetical protein